MSWTKAYSDGCGVFQTGQRRGPLNIATLFIFTVPFLLDPCHALMNLSIVRSYFESETSQERKVTLIVHVRLMIRLYTHIPNPPTSKSRLPIISFPFLSFSEIKSKNNLIDF